MFFFVAAPVLDISPSDTVDQGDDVILTCSTIETIISIEWQQNGTVLSGETETTLQLTAVNASNGGEYTCTVMIAAGNESTSATLNIRPYITTEPEPQLLRTVPNSATLSCRAMGFPSPSYRWESVEDPTRDLTLNSNSMGDLTFNFVSYSNGGSYVCVAIVDTGTANFTVRSQPGVIIGKLLYNNCNYILLYY